METTLGKRISAYRKQLGLTQEQLAEKLGLTAQAVSKWENDVSCPDITILPKLADIFNITTDELLGREPATHICAAEIVDRKNPSGFEYDSDSGKVDIHWDGIKLEGISLACWVVLTGGIYLAAQLLHKDVSFWNILWPSFLFVFGLFGLYPKFSVLRLGCGLVGAYFLVDKLGLLSVELDSGIILGGIILLFGLGLLVDTMRKSKRKHLHSYIDKEGHLHHGKITHDYSVNGNQFNYDASFGSSVQLIQMDTLLNGTISTNFGEYTVDLNGVASIEPGCRIQADCSFGELTIRVPRKYHVVPDSSTSFASFEIQGTPNTVPAAVINLSADVSFGEICIQYI